MTRIAVEDDGNAGQLVPLRSERAKVVDRRGEERVVKIEETRPERRAVGWSVEPNGVGEPLKRPDHHCKLEVRRGDPVGAGVNTRTKKHRPPFDELSRARPAVPRAALGAIGLELMEIGPQRAFEARKRRLDAIGGVPERRPTRACGRRHGITTIPALEQAAEGDRRSLARLQLRHHAA